MSLLVFEYGPRMSAKKMFSCCKLLLLAFSDPFATRV